MHQIQDKKNSRTTLIAFLGLFTLPVIAAWAAYFSGWFDDIRTTNRGEWVEPIVNFEKFSPVYSDNVVLQMAPNETWKLILPQQVNQCQDEQKHTLCIVNLFMMSQAQAALGKEAKRVEIILYNGKADYESTQLESVKARFLDIQVVNGKSSQSMNLSQQYIYIADPLGNIMLRYPLVKTQQEAFSKGGDIMKDLKKLLKLSRIG